MGKAITFAIIGCGRVSNKHVQALRQVPGATLVAVCDVDQERVRQKAEEAKCAGYTDLREMLCKHPEIDVVSVCAHTGLHASISIECAEAGKHVVVEKPMALTLDDADRMIAKCDEKGRRLFVVKQNRYNLPVLKLREALEAGRFGKMVLGTVRVRWCRDQKYYDADAWRGTWAMDGGVFANQASHHIDLLQWCMGDVESVVSYSATRLVDIEVEDVGTALLRFTSGALGIIEATTATRPKDIEGSLSILGEKGTVEIGGFAVNQMKYWQFSEEVPDDEGVVEKYGIVPENAYTRGHEMFYRDVFGRLTTGECGGALVDGLKGKKSLELITALYESIETGKEVRLESHPRALRLGRG
ncbi:Gfo/Idh/MocA family protein [Verrucomicrobiota bacterium]